MESSFSIRLFLILNKHEVFHSQEKLNMEYLENTIMSEILELLRGVEFWGFCRSILSICDLAVTSGGVRRD